MCDVVTYKWCKECKKSFVDEKWCGELVCNRCINLCWIVDDIGISNRIFECCDYHRPQISPDIVAGGINDVHDNIQKKSVISSDSSRSRRDGRRDSWSNEGSGGSRGRSSVRRSGDDSSRSISSGNGSVSSGDDMFFGDVASKNDTTVSGKMKTYLTKIIKR